MLATCGLAALIEYIYLRLAACGLRRSEDRREKLATCGLRLAALIEYACSRRAPGPRGITPPPPLAYLLLPAIKQFFDG